jgi:hypothetical protein
MTTVIQEDRVRHVLEEDDCETCGHNLRVGDLRFWNGRTGATYCSLECLARRNVPQDAWRECNARFRSRLANHPMFPVVYSQGTLF